MRTSYSPYVVNKGDIVIINNVRFVAKNDFNLHDGSKNLLLKKIDDYKPREYVAEVSAQN